jgi:hypothetical protein
MTGALAPFSYLVTNICLKNSLFENKIFEKKYWYDKWQLDKNQFFKKSAPRHSAQWPYFRHCILILRIECRYVECRDYLNVMLSVVGP